MPKLILTLKELIYTVTPAGKPDRRD